MNKVWVKPKIKNAVVEIDDIKIKGIMYVSKTKLIARGIRQGDLLLSSKPVVKTVKKVEKKVEKKKKVEKSK